MLQGCGFVTFALPEDAARAVKDINGKQLGGRTVQACADPSCIGCYHKPPGQGSQWKAWHLQVEAAQRRASFAERKEKKRKRTDKGAASSPTGPAEPDQEHHAEQAAAAAARPAAPAAALQKQAAAPAAVTDAAPLEDAAPKPQKKPRKSAAASEEKQRPVRTVALGNLSAATRAAAVAHAQSIGEVQACLNVIRPPSSSACKSPCARSRLTLLIFFLWRHRPRLANDTHVSESIELLGFMALVVLSGKLWRECKTASTCIPTTTLSCWLCRPPETRQTMCIPAYTQVEAVREPSQAELDRLSLARDGCAGDVVFLVYRTVRVYSWEGCRISVLTHTACYTCLTMHGHLQFSIIGWVQHWSAMRAAPCSLDQRAGARAQNPWWSLSCQLMTFNLSINFTCSLCFVGHAGEGRPGRGCIAAQSRTAAAARSGCRGQGGAAKTGARRGRHAAVGAPGGGRGRAPQKVAPHRPQPAL